MGFIKAIGSSSIGQEKDLFREIIKCDGVDNGVLIKRITTDNGVIQDQSRLYVQPGQCAIFTDNGAIKDIITEPGMYFMDTSAPTLFQTNIFKGIGATFLETMKRIAYEGQVINQQFVYFVSLTEKIGLNFSTVNSILYNDPQWGPIEVSALGQYAFKVRNPVNLLTNVSGDCYTYGTYEIANALLPYIISSITTEIAGLGVSFDKITTKQVELGQKLMEKINEKIESLGVEITKIVVTNIDVKEEVKKSMRERIAIKMKATSVENKDADIYTKLNQAEAMKDLANNPNSTGATVMGMNMGNIFSGMINSDNAEKQDNSDDIKTES